MRKCAPNAGKTVHGAQLHSRAANILAGMLVEEVGAVVLKGYEDSQT
jgi:hypothetical protein